MSHVAEARDRFVRERPAYAAVAAEVREDLRKSTGRAGIPCRISGRAKELSSFVSKAYRKPYDDPWSQITDKAGVRVTVDREHDIDRVLEIVRTSYEVLEVQDKTRDLRAQDKIGYQGVHAQIQLPDGESVVRECEIQIRTAAQNLWSEMSHELLYKPGVDPDPETRRALTRLAALMEIFDEEVNRRMTTLAAAPGYPLEALISSAEVQFYRFADAPYDRNLSRFVFEVLGPALPSDGDVTRYAARLREFADENQAKLDGVYRRYRDNFDVPLLHQPEALVIFERIEENVFDLEEVWRRSLPEDDLARLRAVWGL